MGAAKVAAGAAKTARAQAIARILFIRDSCDEAGTWSMSQGETSCITVWYAGWLLRSRSQEIHRRPKGRAIQLPGPETANYKAFDITLVTDLGHRKTYVATPLWGHCPSSTFLGAFSCGSIA